MIGEDSVVHEELVRPERLGPALVAATGDDRWKDLGWALVSGGKSNLTFTISSGAGELILRRPPTGELLPSAHDMIREARVQAALSSTEVPVPKIIFVDDENLLGVPAYVMEKVPGHVVRGELPSGFAQEPAEREAMAFALVDTLSLLHQVEPGEVGLGDYGRPEGYLARQVRRWTAQWEKTRTHEVPDLTELARRLGKNVPGQSRSAIVHGDYRTDNVVYDLGRPGVLRAVLDWELSTLGDPLTDLGSLSLFWRGPEDPVLSIIPGISHLPGMPDRSALLERYTSTSGTDLGDLDFYVAFAHFKFAAITQGVSARSRAGATAGQDFGDLDDEVRALGARGLTYT